MTDGAGDYGQVPGSLIELKGQMEEGDSSPFRATSLGWTQDVSSRLLFVAEKQGRGISPAVRGPPGCLLPSPAPSTHHLLRRPQRPLTGLPATQAATGHKGRWV